MRIGPGEELARRVRGLAVGASVVALAIGAHGVAGGAKPDGTALVVLGGVAAVLAAIVTAVPTLGTRRRYLVPMLAAGQVAAHAVLELGGGHGVVHAGEPTGAPMLLAHAAAVLVCAALIASAERIGPRALAALRRILPLIPTALPVVCEPARLRARLDVVPVAPAVCPGAIARRGPPVCA